MRLLGEFDRLPEQLRCSAVGGIFDLLGTAVAITQGYA